MKFWKQIVFSLVILSMAALGWSNQQVLRNIFGIAAEKDNASLGNQRSRNNSIPVIVSKVVLSKNSLEFSAVGTARAQRSIMLKSEDAGKIIEMALSPGKRFNSGDILMRLDDSEQVLAVDLARVRKAQADRVLERFEALKQTGNAAEARLDEVRLIADTAHIELEQALEALDNRILKAPFDGVSGLTIVEQGSRVDAEADIASFDDRSVLLVEFDLPEALLSRVAPNMPITAVTPSYPNKIFEGKIVAVDSRVVASSRTIKIRVAIENELDELRPGASFSINLSFEGNTYPSVPELALQFSKGSLHVWRVRDDKAEKVEVTMVRREDGSVLVDGPLEEEDRVVVEGTQRLNKDTAVNVLGEMNVANQTVPAT